MYFFFVIAWLSVPVHSIFWKDSSRNDPLYVPLCQLGC